MSVNSFGIMSSASGFSITPSDTVDLPYPIRGLFIGTGGDIQILLQDDTDPITLVNVQSGSLYPLQVKRVYADGLTADDIVGLR
jgi:hypothetical protein